jgi:hypothetical protein
MDRIIFSAAGHFELLTNIHFHIALEIAAKKGSGPRTFGRL